jgi:hypothetical protein
VECADISPVLPGVSRGDSRTSEHVPDYVSSLEIVETVEIVKFGVSSAGHESSPREIVQFLKIVESPIMILSSDLYR